MFLLVYIDDIIIARSSSSAVDLLLGQLQSDFALKDLGALSYFLAIEVKKVVDGIYLSQTKYTSYLLKCAGMLTCKPSPMPLATSAKLSVHGEGRESSQPKMPQDIDILLEHYNISP
jgi:hypothetical protein